MNITTGMTYRFRYRAMNVNGWSDWSPIGYIQASGKPLAPIPPSLFASDDETITLNINPTLDNGGSPILSYKLFMDEGDLTSDFSMVYGYNGEDS
jgi:hypothetical protein